MIKFRDTLANEKSEVGLVTGLAWTEVGGSILSTEVTVVDGKGKLTLTGKLGDVMQESAQAAMSYVRSRAAAPGPAARLLSQPRHPRSRARRRHPERRPLGGHYHRHGHRQRAEQDSGAARSRHDRRNHAARQGSAHRRLKEKLLAAHRAGIFEVILPGQRERPGGSSREPASSHEAAFRRDHGRCAGARAGEPAARRSGRDWDTDRSDSGDHRKPPRPTSKVCHPVARTRWHIACLQSGRSPHH